MIRVNYDYSYILSFLHDGISVRNRTERDRKREEVEEVKSKQRERERERVCVRMYVERKPIK